MANRRQLPLLLTTLLLLTIPAAAIQDPIRTPSGLVSGIAGKKPEVRVYRGIPYAAPPVGALRWKEPQAALPWTGTLEAKEFSKACMQQPPRPGSFLEKNVGPPGPVDEDCLYLNIWTAAKSSTDKRPVMVWIHGGSLRTGTGSNSRFDGEALASDGVVVVTLNYRLGVLGFLALPELTQESPHHASGNYGLLDVVAALRWVKRNIAAFGGDPERVTLFGQSAGSWMISLIATSPLGKGLFQRMIGESSAKFGLKDTLEDAERNGRRFSERLKAPSLTALRSRSAADLLVAQEPQTFDVVIDGWSVPADPSLRFSRRQQNDVALIVGYNADESRTFSGPATAKNFLEESRKRFGGWTEEFLKLYPFTSDESASEARYNSSRDREAGWQMRSWVRFQTKYGRAPAYFYYFTHVPPITERERYRAFHSAEIPYVFGNPGSDANWTNLDHQLSAIISSYWVDFAKSGNPNAKGLPYWPRYDAESDPVIEFGDSVVVRHEVNKAGLDFLDRFFSAHSAQKNANPSQ